MSSLTESTLAFFIALVGLTILIVAYRGRADIWTQAKRIPRTFWVCIACILPAWLLPAQNPYLPVALVTAVLLGFSLMVAVVGVAMRQHAYIKLYESPNMSRMGMHRTVELVGIFACCHGFWRQLGNTNALLAITVALSSFLLLTGLNAELLEQCTVWLFSVSLIEVGYNSWVLLQLLEARDRAIQRRVRDDERRAIWFESDEPLGGEGPE